MLTRLAGLLALSTLCIGCASPIAEQYREDAHGMRQTLLVLLEDQVMDNLVRAKLNRPLVHVDYETMTGKAALSRDATIGVTGNEDANDALGLTFKGSASNDVSVLAKPVLAKSSIYDTYREFSQKLKGPICRNEPKPGGVHLGHWFEEKYYYVSTADADEFYRTFVNVTLDRDKATTKKPLTAKVVQIVDDPESADPDAVLILLSTLVPNSMGEIEVEVKNYGTFSANVASVTRFEGANIPYGAPTKALRMRLDPRVFGGAPVEEIRKSLVNQTLTFDLEVKAPRARIESFDAAATFDSIRESLERIDLMGNR